MGYSYCNGRGVTFGLCYHAVEENLTVRMDGKQGSPVELICTV
jgi:hypothetical protein